MANIIFAGILGLAFSTLQLLLMRRVLHMQKPWQRALLMAAKLPLWAMAFIGIALWWGAWPLLAFGIAAGGMYVLVAITVYVRSRKQMQPGDKDLQPKGE